MNWQKDQNPGLLVILLLGILSVHHQQLLPVEEGDVHVPHQHPFRHSALGSSEPRHMLLTELILCVLAVILHKTVVFDRKNNSSLLCWGQWQPGIRVAVVVVIRLVSGRCNTAWHSFCPTPTTSWRRGQRCQCSSSTTLS